MPLIKLTKSLLPLMLAGLLGAASLVAYGDEASGAETSMDDVKAQADAFLQTLKEYSAEQKDEAVASSRQALDDLDRRIERLEAWISQHWSEMDQAAREEAQETLREMRRQRIELAEWYGSMKSSSADAWDDMKQGFSEAYGALQRAWEKSVQEYRSDEKPAESGQ